MRTCKNCNQTKGLENFKVNRKGFPMTYCIGSCTVLENRRVYLKATYGLTLEQYENMLAAQGGKCANTACGATEPGFGRTNFCVDHNHDCCPGEKSCGKCVRKLLCQACNVSLGNQQDDVNKLMGLVTYLLEFENVVGKVDS